MSNEVNLRKSNKRSVSIMIAIVIGMFGFGFALVPIYNVMCKTLGINGKTSGQVSQTSEHGVVDNTRTVLVEFLTTNNTSLHDWKFYPLTRKIKVHPGEENKVAFYAENTTDHDMTVQAIPSVTPGYAAKHFKKIECFCFTQQTLKAHEVRKMPLRFRLDLGFPKGVNTTTLSYTLFNVTDKAKKS